MTDSFSDQLREKLSKNYYSQTSESGATWTARDSTRDWYKVASSADGTKLVAAVFTIVVGRQIYTSSPNTSVGTSGSISGGQYDAVDLQCAGNNTLIVRGYAGDLDVQ